MGKWLVAVFAALLLACPALAGQAHFSAVVSATETNTNTAISGMPGSGGNKARTVIIINDGPDEVFLNFTTGVAAASGAYLMANETMTVTGDGGNYITNVGLICNGSETATVRIFAFPTE